MNIILIGFMGAGKSEIGRRLAKELKCNFLDTDELIEKSDGRKIADIFKEEGEDFFRGLETEVLGTLQDYENFVLATGGGIVLKEENVALLKSMGRVVLLFAEPEVIYARVKSKTHRPLLQVADPEAEIRKILSYRDPFYIKAADFKVDTSKLSPDEVVKGILEWLK